MEVPLGGVVPNLRVALELSLLRQRNCLYKVEETPHFDSPTLRLIRWSYVEICLAELL